MAFSSTDLTNVETAIQSIMNGTRVVEITVAGKTTRYQAPQIEVLLKLRDQIKQELVTSGSGGMFNKVRFDRPL